MAFLLLEAGQTMQSLLRGDTQPRRTENAQLHRYEFHSRDSDPVCGVASPGGALERSGEARGRGEDGRRGGKRRLQRQVGALPARSPLVAGRLPAVLAWDDFSSNRHPVLTSSLSMIFSENRHPLFGIML
jgi:hypothetical protein